MKKEGWAEGRSAVDGVIIGVLPVVVTLRTGPDGLLIGKGLRGVGLGLSQGRQAGARSAQ